MNFVEFPCSLEDVILGFDVCLYTVKFEVFISQELEYRGVMRFFFQDAGAKMATKCIRVTSLETAEDVTRTLVEKFRPDMKMLTNPNYSLYEVHPNGGKLGHREAFQMSSFALV